MILLLLKVDIMHIQRVKSKQGGRLYAYSGESVHLFRRKASTCSEDNRPGVPGETVRYYRSVATLVFSIFQSSRSLSSLNAAFS